MQEFTSEWYDGINHEIKNSKSDLAVITDLQI